MKKLNFKTFLLLFHENFIFTSFVTKNNTILIKFCKEYPGVELFLRSTDSYSIPCGEFLIIGRHRGKHIGLGGREDQRGIVGEMGTRGGGG